MDTFSAQPIPPQENPIVLTPQNRTNFRKFFNISSWIILFALLPITVLIFLSQDSIPGDFFYPAKRGMENVILVAASVSPATKAAFRTDLTATRFKEAQNLIVSRSNTSGLTTFIDDIQSTQFEVANLKNDAQRDKAEEKLISKIEEYQAGLSTLETKTEQTIITYRFQEIPDPTFTPTPTLIPTSTPVLSPSSKSQLIPTLTLTPTPTPVKQASSASSEASAPTSILSPTIAPTVPPQQENTQVAEQKKIAQTIKETKEQLHKIKKDLEEKRNEDRQKDSKRDEAENPDRQNKPGKNTH